MPCSQILSKFYILLSLSSLIHKLMADLDIQPHQQRSMRTTAAVNPSDVSLWRLADRVMNKTNLQLEPTIEELEEKATVVTFL